MQDSKRYHCKEFAEDLRHELKLKEISEETIILNAGGKYGIDSLEQGNTAENKYHEAIKIGDTIYDNMNPHGVPYNIGLDDIGYNAGFPGYNFKPITPKPF